MYSSNFLETGWERGKGMGMADPDNKAEAMDRRWISI